MNGKTYKVLVEGDAKSRKGYLAGRTDSNIVVEFPAPENAEELIGTYQSVKITEALNWVLRGQLEAGKNI